MGCASQPNAWLEALSGNCSRSPEPIRWDPNSKSLSFKQHTLTLFTCHSCVCSLPSPISKGLYVSLQKNSVFVFQFLVIWWVAGKDLLYPLLITPFQKQWTLVPATASTNTRVRWPSQQTAASCPSRNTWHSPYSKIPHRASPLTGFLLIVKY